MASNTSLWQANWQIDPVDDVATHDTGLHVRLTDGKGTSDNATVVIESLIPVHGAHNATAMVGRLVREGEQILIDPNSRGWRGKERRE